MQLKFLDSLFTSVIKCHMRSVLKSVKIELFVIRRLTMSVDKDSFGGAGDYLDN